MRLDEYDLLSPADKKLFERYLENPSAFTLAPMNDAATRREVKVARFRLEKELKQKLEVSRKLTTYINPCSDLSTSTSLRIRVPCRPTTM
jgi:hypothetical protein